MGLPVASQLSEPNPSPSYSLAPNGVPMPVLASQRASPRTVKFALAIKATIASTSEPDKAADSKPTIRAVINAGKIRLSMFEFMVNKSEKKVKDGLIFRCIHLC